MAFKMEPPKWTEYQIRPASAASQDTLSRQKAEATAAVSPLVTQNDVPGENAQHSRARTAVRAGGSRAGFGAYHGPSTKDVAADLSTGINIQERSAPAAAQQNKDYPTIYLYSYVESFAPYHVQRWIPPVQMFDITFNEFKKIIPMKLIEGHILTFTLFSEQTGMMYRVSTGTATGFDWVKERFSQVVKNFIEIRGTRDIPNFFYIRIE